MIVAVSWAGGARPIVPLSYTRCMLKADALAPAVRVEGIEQAVYIPAGRDARADAITERLISSCRSLWQRVAWLHPWQVVVELGSGLGEMMVAVPLPPGSRLVAAENSSVELPLLRRSIAEAERSIELIVSDVSLASHSLAGLANVASLASTPGTAQNVCFRIGWQVDAETAMEQLDPLLDQFTRWAVVVTLSGLGPQKIAELARGRFLFLMDRRTHNLVRVGSGRSEAAVSRMLGSGWLHPGEAVLLSSAELAGTW